MTGDTHDSDGGRVESEVCRRQDCDAEAEQKVRIDMKAESTHPFPTVLCGPCIDDARESDGAEIKEVLEADVA